MEKTKTLSPNSGYFGLFLGLLMVLMPLINIIIPEYPIVIGISVFILFLGIFTFTGLMVVDPNESRVLILFGKYNGTVKQNGFYWVNPFNMKKKISLRARNFDSELIKVNDKVGNPILIGVILVWKVEETSKAAFAVDDYVNFL